MPLTSNVERLYPCEAYVELNGERRKAMADQVATVPKKRLQSEVGRLSVSDMANLERAIWVQLGL